MRFGRSLCVVVLAAGAAVAGGLSPAPSVGADGSALVEPASTSSGVVELPVAYREDPPASPAFGSSEFIVSPATVSEGTDQPRRDVIRVSDGAVVRTVPVDSPTTFTNAPSISAGHLMTRVTEGSITTITVDDLTTGAISTYQLPWHRAALAHPDWAAVTRGSGDPAVFLHRPDGTSSMVAGPFQHCTTVNLLDSDEHGVILEPSCGEHGPSLLTVATGTVTPAPGRHLTPHLVIGTRAVSGGHEVTWAPRTDLTELHTTTIASTEPTSFYPWGDGLVAKTTPPCDASRCGGELRVVDLETGSLGAVVATHVVAQYPTAEGGLLVTVDDGDHGRVELLREGRAPHVVTSLPAQPIQPGYRGLSGTRIVTSSREIRGDVLKEYADGVWSTVADPDTGGSLTTPSSPNHDIRIVGDHVALRRSDGTWRLVWPGGSRVVNSPSALQLGHGGDLVQLTRFEGAGRWRVEVQDFRTGTVVTSADTHAAADVVLDGSWIWRIADAFTLEGVDTAAPGVTRRVKVGTTCPRLSGLDVRGRWAMLSCGYEDLVVDLRGVMKPYYPEGPRDDVVWHLGNDFAYGVSSAPGAPIQVTDFSAAHQTRLVGPGASGVVADDAGGHALAWTGQFGRFFRADLDWVTVPPTERDRSAPRLVATSGSPRYASSAVDGRRAVSFGWRFVDPTPAEGPAPSGVATYEARWRVGTPAGVWSPWSTPFRTTQRSVSRTFRAERTACFQVRARDRAGNLSSWSPSRCTSIDGEPPVLTRTSIDTSRRDIFTLRYRAADTFGISHYVVRYRKGSSATTWISPSAWRNLTETSVSLRRDQRRTCFRITAVDRVGRSTTATTCVGPG